MKRLIAGLVAGAVLGSTGIAVAASTWTQAGSTYECMGNNRIVFCEEDRNKYEVALASSLVAVSYQGKLIFSCTRGEKPAGNCKYYRR